MKKRKRLKEEMVFLECEVVDDDEKAPVGVLFHTDFLELKLDFVAPSQDVSVDEVAEVKAPAEEALVVKDVEVKAPVEEVLLVEDVEVKAPAEEVLLVEDVEVKAPAENKQIEDANEQSNVALASEKDVAADMVKAIKKPTAKKATESKTVDKKATPSKSAAKAVEKAKPEENVIIAGDDSIPHGKFVIRKTDKGHFVFKLFSSNHRVIAIGGEQYASLASCKTGINSVIANATDAPIEDQTLQKWTEQKCPKWQIYTDKKEEIRLRLLASNGNIVATTNDGYLSKSSAKNGINAVIRAVEGCEVVRNDNV